jgi:nucleoid-associated protein YgaU
MAIIASIIQLLALIGEAFKKWQHTSEIKQARIDATNAEKLRQIQMAQEVETRAKEAEGAINDKIHKPIDNSTLNKLLREGKL